jgi:probable phosphoglycerate mutase
MTLIYLVRHGETDWNLAKRIQGNTDIPLNDTGRAQAATSGRLLARRDWDLIVTSPLSRARETAEIIARETGLATPVEIDALVERHYGDAEGLDYRTIEERYPNNADVPGRESREDVAARVLPAIMALADAHPEQNLVVVSHGGVIRTILQTVAPESDHGTIRNGSIHSFSHTDGTLDLIAFDDPIEIESLECAEEDIREQNALERR